MKKVIISLLFVILLTGCTSNLLNTPTKKVEMFFNKYQSLDDDVLSQLKNVVDNEISFTKEQGLNYIEIMKKHYQTLKYRIKDEVIDGDTAVVTVEIEVNDYSKILKEADLYLENHKEEFIKKQDEERQNMIEQEKIEEKIEKQPEEKIEERCIEEETFEEPEIKKEIKNLFSDFSDDNEYSTYYVYILREGDNIDTIMTKYGITREILSEYNNIDEIKIGDKIIIPEKNNARN